MLRRSFRSLWEFRGAAVWLIRAVYAWPFIKNFRFYDISELSARIDSCENDDEREYWQRLASFNNNYLYNYMLMDEPMDLLTEQGKANYQLFQQYRHYRVLNPLVLPR